MKLLIDIPESEYKRIMKFCEEHTTVETAYARIWSGKVVEEQEPCEDAVSREAVIDAIRFGISNIRAFNDTTMIRFYERENEALKKAIERVNELPSVTGRPTGHWTPLTRGNEPIPYKHYLFTTNDGYVVLEHWGGQFSKYTAYMELPEPYKGESG